ncbi:MAG: SDR family oxidoreductase [Methylobacteriaceae bacterium]|nr:SDR family oxidoreductase [Methylobacteriaceae bacterium]
MSKTIIVTGGSRGIGRAAALLCGLRGWSVVVNYVGAEAAARETAREIEAAGAAALVVQGDMSVEADVTRLFDAAAERFGVIDGLVNNAGIVAPGMSFVDMDAARWRRIFDLNVIGAMLCAQAAARVMRRSAGGRGGAIVNISSVAARLGSPGLYVDYAASKGAIDSFTHGLGIELAREGVRVNAIRPGMIETDIHAASGDPDRAKKLAHTIPIGRPGSAREIAEAIVWLLDDASSYVTGAILDVSGGR